MKTVTFFNEKGGVGKTTLNVLLASWLRYVKGENVAIMDFDYPNFHVAQLKNNEMRILQQGKSPFADLCAGNDFYDIYKIDVTEGKSKNDSQKAVYTMEYLQSLEQKIRSIKNAQNGYLLFDFPGRFAEGEPFYYLVSKGLIDEIIFPVDSDKQSCSSAMFVWSVVNSEEFVNKYHLLKAPNCSMLWNKETQSERAGVKAGKGIDYYATYQRKFEDFNIKVFSHRIHQIDILKRDYVPGTPHTLSFLRSTLCYPVLNAKRSCPYLEEVFQEIKDRVDGNK